MSGDSRGESGHQALSSPVDSKEQATSHASAQAKVLRILVVGVTGSGKSTFIASASGRDVGIGHGADSCTKVCKVYPTQYNIGGVKLELIDTPGFDDPHRDDYEVLKDITKVLRGVSGVIYCHRINDTRLIGNSRLNLEILKAMCGMRFYSRVVICSTMWNTFPQNITQQKLEVHRGRMEELLGTGFRDLMDKGARYMEFHADRRDPCLDILRSFLSQRFPPEMAIMEELSERYTMPETRPGLVIKEHRRGAMEGRSQDQASAKIRKQQQDNNYDERDHGQKEGSSLKKNVQKNLQRVFGT
ncbi:P-loop containing nucleoside triphosphate hydrolase protein [Xylaria sp. FL1777]|nr:P-loop containing nucleoside triphosphate hydrolase protein [Xylaria sp. FL1777]